jgi:hypothetical protein
MLPEKLFVIFQNTNEWLKFAEAKNAALLAFSGTGMTATLTLLATAQNLPNSLRVGLLLATAFLCLCSFICTFSFLPRIHLEKVLWLKSRTFQNAKPSTDDNLYYFGHLQKYSPNELLEAINRNYLNSSITIPYEKESQDLATQITINAAIAFRKYQLFTYGTYCLAIAILIVPVSILFSLIFFRGL